MLKSDIPFARDDANRFLPWMIGLMSAIAALMLCVGITLGGMVQGQRMTADGFTVQLPQENEKTAKQVLALVEKAPGVRKAAILPQSEVQSLVSPWLGNNEALKALPLPTVIEADGANVNTESLRREIQRIAPEATVDTQAVWAEKFARLSLMLEAGIYVLTAVIVAALAGMMVAAARTAMKLHAGTVKLLHSIGAEDAYIAHQFHGNALALALRGAAPGTLAAGVIYALLAFYAWKLDVPILTGGLMGWTHVAMLAMLPVLACVISAFAVRAAVMGQLRRLP